MKEELIKLYKEFVEHIEMVNSKEYREEKGLIFEDYIEPTLANFMKWLMFTPNLTNENNE